MFLPAITSAHARCTLHSNVAADNELMATHTAQPTAAATAGEFNVGISITVCPYCSLNMTLDIVLSGPLPLLLRIAGIALTRAERVLPILGACSQAATQMEQVEVHCESSSTELSLLRAVPPAEGTNLH
jgi:hypothetical protein